MARSSSSEISQAVFNTLTYSDIFDYPLTAREVHRYLAGVEAAFEEVQRVLEGEDSLERSEIYFALSGRTEIMETRRQREARSRELLPYALKYGRILGSLPFVRMVALTGSLAVMNVSDKADFDYMLVASPGRVWTARAFALLLNRFTRLLFGHTLCPNLIVSETSLGWRQRDLYSARELCQMIPITGLDVYHKLMAANGWVKEFLPNADLSMRGATHFAGSDEAILGLVKEIALSDPDFTLLHPAVPAMTEWVLRRKIGDLFERWEMNRKVARFSKQTGFGEETAFNAEVCQGNFDHHRKRTQKLFQQRINNLGDGDFPLRVREGSGAGTV